jgi:predicted amidohydrolase YtcJ
VVSSSATDAADLLVLGRIATLEGNEGFGWAEAMAVRGGRVLAAGARAEVAGLAGNGARVWRLPPDLAVLPGITDAHLHLVMAALAATQLDLSGISGRAETLAAVRAAHLERAAAGDGQGWLLGHGWSLDRLGGWPSAEDLEAAAPGRRIALWSHDHHTRWVSVAALAAAAIDGSRASPPGGQIRRDERGQPTGILHESAATLVDSAIPSPSREEVEQAILD